MAQKPEKITPSRAAKPVLVPARPTYGQKSATAPLLPSDSEKALQDIAGPLFASIPPPAPIEKAPEQRAGIPRWMERAELFLRVVLRMYVGLAICYAPWSKLFWDQNPLFEQYPTLAHYAANGAVRGLVSGLGILNLWFALQDAFRQKGR